MSKFEKLRDKLFSNPKDFNWSELIKILNGYGYSQLPTGKTGGSRRKFVDASGDIINLHEPHPEKTVKSYVIKEIIEKLQKKDEAKKGKDSS